MGMRKPKWSPWQVQPSLSRAFFRTSCTNAQDAIHGDQELRNAHVPVTSRTLERASPDDEVLRTPPRVPASSRPSNWALLSSTRELRPRRRPDQSLSWQKFRSDIERAVRARDEGTRLEPRSPDASKDTDTSKERRFEAGAWRNPYVHDGRRPGTHLDGPPSELAPEECSARAVELDGMRPLRNSGEDIFAK